ncbi:YceK/YidQ family lipoprotein [Vibrio alginolyticus]|uniref:YceK/YidQ family lipoprotein n=1 Tax=Vibrio alginolyticus TaxID=663 RepID=UPI000720B2DC|nr:YceK/YidQ family lipoprotein [Vibrio alginolyticus]ALR91683.1 hypothetical protein AT730_04475 [Vibrio alginolyticus]MBY7710566.1 YceK/YidQ family lipoprotein [Vibrio alginolyticus]
MLKKLLIMTTITLTTVSCSSLKTKLNGKVGEPYAGFESSKEGFMNCTVLSIIGFPPLALIVAPIMSVDVVGSLVLDTAFLPVDLLVEDTDVDVSDLCEIHFGHF